MICVLQIRNTMLSDLWANPVSLLRGKKRSTVSINFAVTKGSKRINNLACGA